MNSNTEANVTVEIPFRTEKAHANPFLDLTLGVVFTDPGGTPTEYHPPQLSSPQDWVLVLEKS